MDEEAVRTQAQALCDALVAGDMDRVIADFSVELQRNLGEVLTLLPLPATEATIQSVEHGASSGYVAVLRLIGETDEVEIETRWKDRDGHPTIVEASHLSATPAAGPPEGEEAAADRSPGEDRAPGAEENAAATG